MGTVSLITSDLEGVTEIGVDRGSFDNEVKYLGRSLIHAPTVDTGHWQSIKNVPQTKTRELRSVVFVYDIPDDVHTLEMETMPSEPWAELQFQERVGGQPLNPGETFKQWPWYRGNVEAHKEQGQFSHTYMERYWPRYAGLSQARETGTNYQNSGIRYGYGDLNNVVGLLEREPHTRQAVLPVWFPEDTGAVHGGRVPCSLTYHFMLREGKLHCWYDIRSCDFLRHFRDDVYLTCRLVQWVLDKLQTEFNTVTQDNGFDWDSVVPGELTMVMHSLHVFEGDMPKMEREYGSS